MSWFSKLLPSRVAGNNDDRRGRSVPEGIWLKCINCYAILYRAELERNLQVCPKCSYHLRINAQKRLKNFLDSNTQKEIGASLRPIDTLKFKDKKKYKDRLHQAQKATNETDALIVFSGQLKGIQVVTCAFEFEFMGGSMGSVVGERFVQAIDMAIELQSALICFSASGGARMQEGLFSLWQMAKVSAAIGQLRRKHLPYLSVLTDPTMGGVSASLAMLGDINIAEPNALIGFAGPRVIEQTVRETLPEGFQRSEFLLKHGSIDMIMDRREMRDRITNLLSILLHLPHQTIPTDDEIMSV